MTGPLDRDSGSYRRAICGLRKISRHWVVGGVCILADFGDPSLRMAGWDGVFITGKARATGDYLYISR